MYIKKQVDGDLVMIDFMKFGKNKTYIILKKLIFFKFMRK